MRTRARPPAIRPHVRMSTSMTDVRWRGGADSKGLRSQLRRATALSAAERVGDARRPHSRRANEKTLVRPHRRHGVASRHTTLNTPEDVNQTPCEKESRTCIRESLTFPRETASTIVTDLFVALSATN